MLIKSLEDGDVVEDVKGTYHAENVVTSSDANSERRAIKMLVGAGARLLFYPTLLYNVLRNKLEADFRWWDQIEQYVLLGAVPFPKDVFRLRDLGVQAVITLNESYETLVSGSLYESQMIKHLVIPTQDYLFAPTFESIERAVDFIYANVQEGKTTYVHCKAGRGRSTTVVLCYLVKYRGMTPLDAFQFVRAIRPRVMLAASQWKAVLSYNDYQHALRSHITMAPLHGPGVRPLHTDDDGEPLMMATRKDGCCGELPVLVTLSDLEGYNETQVMLDENEFRNIGTVYKVRLMAAKSVIGVAKASAALARLSYIWLGCQAGSQAFNLTLTCSSLSDGNTQLSTCEIQSLMHQPVVTLHVCQQGLVEC